MTGQKGNTKRAGSLSAKYRTVPAHIIRVLYRPTTNPPRLYYICWRGVFMLDPTTYDKAKMIARGYRRVKMSKCKNDIVMERTLGR